MKAKPKSKAVENPLTDDDKMLTWDWSMTQGKEAGDWVVFAFGPLPKEAGVSAERVIIARCPSQRMAREILLNRNVSEAATNWIGLLHRNVANAFKSEEAVQYREAWRRGGIPLVDEKKCEHALDTTPIEPPSPYEYSLS